jgi:hypothetical protein
VPVDVRRAESECSSAEPCCNLILDQTTTDAGFDIECLDGLDEMLLFSPVDAFAAVCWDTAIQIPSKPSLLPTPLMKPLLKQRPEHLPSLSRSHKVQKSTIPHPHRRPASLIIVTETSSEEEESEYESDSDELKTLKDEIDGTTPFASPLPSPFPSPLPSPYDTGFHQPMVEPITLVSTSQSQHRPKR